MKVSKKRVDMMVTAFRDGFQSVYGARVRLADYLPAIEAARDAGVRHFEAGGGATFQSAFFYAAENAFDVLDSFREAAGPEANLQTLARGINVVGLDSQPSDIIRLHAELFAKHGVTTIRNFDALNDVNNLVYSGRCITEAGLNHEVCVTLMGVPPDWTEAHTPEFYEHVLRGILNADIPYDSVCFKDASGTAPPWVVYETIARARKLLPENARIAFHTHETAGTSVICYRAALDAGADQIDLSLAPVSGGTCQPDVVTMWHALRGTEYDLDVDIDKILEAERVFKECMRDYFLPPEAKAVEPVIPFSPMPGGALTANTQMMRDNGTLDRFPEVIAAMEEAVRRGGYGTSVTPVSQFYFQQAYNNVFLGPWKRIAHGYGLMVLGYYGRPPGTPDPEIVRKAAEQLGREPTEKSPLELNDAEPSKGREAARTALEREGLPTTDENIFIVATCKDKGIAFLKGEVQPRLRKKEPASQQAVGAGAQSGAQAAAHSGAAPETEAPGAAPRSATAGASQAAAGNLGAESRTYAVSLNGETFTVTVDRNRARVNRQEYQVEVVPSRVGHANGGTAGPQTSSAGIATDTAGSASASPGAQGTAMPPASQGTEVPGATFAASPGTEVKTPLAGSVVRVSVREGQQVSEGDTVLVVEAMKMETAVSAPVSGAVARIAVGQGDHVSADQPVAWIR